MTPPPSLGAVAAAVASVVAAASGFLLPDGNPLRVALSLLLVLVLPGYALTAALFRDGRLGRSETTLMSVGLSLSTVIVSGLALNLTPGGLRQQGWAIALSGVTVVAAAIGATRRGDRSGTTPRPPVSWPRITRVQAALFGLAGVILLAAFHVAIYGARQDADETTFTQLWLLAAEDRPTPSVTVGVRNEEGADQVYALVVTLEGKLLASWPELGLAEDETWETTLALPAGRGVDSPVRVELFRAEAPDVVYRYAVLWPTSSAVSVRRP